MENSINMQDLNYQSNPSNILAIGRNQRNKINYTVKSIERYISSQGAKMIKYVCFCESIYSKKSIFYVSYGLDGNDTNISLHPSLAATNFK
jgi:hypothetical protein